MLWPLQSNAPSALAEAGDRIEAADVGPLHHVVLLAAPAVQHRERALQASTQIAQEALVAVLAELGEQQLLPAATLSRSDADKVSQRKRALAEPPKARRTCTARLPPSSS